ncbi:Peptidase M23 [Sediminispirochaeta smaragdinae DSM 11293]|uniref:Peptidase M23 n=2 Tax=Sediminispirochaeta TaxID=1911556 RepID=E1RAA6_SEDSS|nr:Peptidase M23 [Sediminispirochaeta smaragdinae DSM 11293]
MKGRYSKRQMEERLELLTEQIIHTLLARLGTGRASSSKPVKCQVNGLIPGTYTLSMVRINPKELLLQELVSTKTRGNVIFRSWTFRKEEKWYVAGMEKLGKPVFYRSIGQDLADLVRRNDTVSAVEASEGMYLVETAERAARNLGVELPSDYELKRNGLYPKSIRFLTKHSALVAVLLIAVGIGTILGLYALKIGSIESEMNKSVKAYTANIDDQVKSFLDDTEDEILGLINDVEKNRKNFEFDKRNAYLNVQRLAEELTRYTPARKRAYRLIADNILQSTTYSEIMYEMSRLPTEEYQARIFLATNRQSVIPLASFTPAIPGMLYPVRVDGENNDGRGFRITDGYMDRRENPLGTGGSSPHFAVDIINVSNIAYVSHAGEIIREGNPPGDVVAVAPGAICDTGWDDGYGWYIEINHGISDEVKALYPDAERWCSYYAHLDEKPTQAIGTKVEADALIGHIGNTGRSTGPHLHFEVRIYHKNGSYRSGDARYDKINPYPAERQEE